MPSSSTSRTVSRAGWADGKGPGRAPSCRSALQGRSDHEHLGAHVGEFVKLEDMLVVEPDAAVRRPAPDLPRVVGAVDAVIRPAQMHGAHAERVVRARTT